MRTLSSTRPWSRARLALPSWPLAPGVVLSLAAVYLIWSSTYLALRFMVRELPPLASSGLRFLLAGALLYGALRLRGSPAPSAREWLLSTLAGSLMFFVGNGFVAIAAREVPSGVTAMSIGAVPLFLSAMEAALGQRPGRRQWLGLGLGFAGVVCMGLADAHATPAAALLLLVAPIGWASASLLVRKGGLPAGAMGGATQLLGGGATLLAGGLLLGERFAAWPGASSALAFVYLVVCGSIVGFSAAMYLLRNAPASIATSYAYVNPVLAVGLGAVLGGEQVRPPVLFAGALVVAGVALLVTGSRRG